MSVSESEIAVGAKDLAAVMRGFQTPLSARQIEQNIAQAQSIQTMRFVWHCAANINNRGINKTRENMIYPELPRMTLIPLYSWPVPVIRARNAQFSIGHFTQYGASLGPTGTTVGQRSMLSWESKLLLEKWYGPVGCLALESLTTDTDTGKAEALLLYEAIMTNTRPLGDEQKHGTPGVDVVIEDLPKFLEEEAPLLLQYAMKHGVTFKGSDFWPQYPAGRYRIRDDSYDKGLLLIEDFKRNVEVTLDHIQNDETGVLVVTRGQLKQAEAGVKDSKSRTDRRDEFYLRQCPSFSMDSAVERAQIASRSVVKSIEESSGKNADVQTALLSTLVESLEELKAMRQSQSDLAREVAHLKSQLPTGTSG